LIVGNSDFTVFSKTSTHSNEYNKIVRYSYRAYSYIQYSNQQTHSIKHKAQNTIYDKNFNILMIPVRVISAQISTLHLYSFVLEDSLRMAPLCRNM